VLRRLTSKTVDDIRGLLSTLENVLVSSLVDLLNLVTAEYNSLNGPVGVLNVVNLGSGGRDDTKVCDQRSAYPSISLNCYRLFSALRSQA
jgi:hypothetical protein